MLLYKKIEYSKWLLILINEVMWIECNIYLLIFVDVFKFRSWFVIVDVGFLEEIIFDLEKVEEERRYEEEKLRE